MPASVDQLRLRRRRRSAAARPAWRPPPSSARRARTSCCSTRPPGSAGSTSSGGTARCWPPTVTTVPRARGSSPPPARPASACLPGRLVWGVDDDGRTLLAPTALTADDPLAITPRACIVATGAYERAIPFPGWQLPGVVTPGHALHLATCDLVPLGPARPGRRDRAVPARRGLRGAAGRRGSRWPWLELNRPYAPGRGRPRRRRLSVPAGRAGRVRRHPGPPPGAGAARATGSLAAHGRWAGLRGRASPVPAPGAAPSTPSPSGFGFRPATELLRLLGADCDPGRAGRRLPAPGPPRPHQRARRLRGGRGRPDRRRAGRDRGRPAGRGRRGRRPRPAARPRPRALHAARARLAAERRFAALTARLYPVTAADCVAMPDETMVCRCEGVSAAELRQAGATGPARRQLGQGRDPGRHGPVPGPSVRRRRCRAGRRRGRRAPSRPSPRGCRSSRSPCPRC